MNQITILHHLRKQKTLLQIRLRPPTGSINITDTAEPALRPRRRINRHKRVPRPVLVRAIPRDTIGVVITLDDLGSQVVTRIGNVEASRVIECSLFRGHGGAVPGKGLGPDVCGGGGVGVVAAVDEGKAEVDVVLAGEDLAAEEEVAAVEAGKMLG